MKTAAGVGLIVAGVAGFVIFLIVRLSGFPDGLRRVPIPARQEIELKAGKQVVYYEVRGSTLRVPKLEIELRPRGGEPLAFAVSSVLRRYQRGGLRGQSVGIFETPSAGIYELECRGAADGGSLAIGPDLLGGLLITLAGGFAILGVAVPLGIRLLRAARRA